MHIRHCDEVPGDTDLSDVTVAVIHGQPITHFCLCLGDFFGLDLRLGCLHLDDRLFPANGFRDSLSYSFLLLGIF